MRKKNAFTLIELLAVILILAILALIVSPIIMGVVSSANKESAARSLEGYAEAINNAIAKYALINKGKMPKELSQVEEYIEAKNKENVIVRESEITKGSISSITAIIGDYICTYTQNSGATCEDVSDEYLTKKGFIQNPSILYKMVHESQISRDCIWGNECTEEEIEKMDKYFEEKYNVSHACWYDWDCVDSDEEERYDNIDNDRYSNSFYGINGDEIGTITFSNQKPAGNYYLDVSENQDKSILLYRDESDIIIYSDDIIKFPEDSFNFFSELGNLTEINFNNMIDTSNVKSMASMFEKCGKINNFDLSSFNTSNVIDMSRMFSSCTAIVNIDVSGFDTRNVTTMQWMFGGCSGLTELDVSNFVTDNASYIGGMFYKCSGLTELDVSNFNTSNAIYINDMFYGCSGLTELNVSNFNTSNAVHMSGMFSGCSGLTELDINNFDTGSAVYMTDMFSKCSGLTTIDVSNFDTSNVVNMQYMFYSDSNLEHIYVGSNWNTDLVTVSSNMFKSCTKLPNFVSSKVDKTNANTSATGYLTLKTV